MIRSVAVAVPKTVVRNLDARFVAATGVKERRVCIAGQDAMTLAIEAVDALPIPPQPFGAVICVTQTPSVLVPPMACSLAAVAGAPRNAIAFDVRQACDGYVYALMLASRMPCAHVLVVAGDCTSEIADPKEPGTANLFGDAMSATWWENAPVEESFPPRFVFGTDGSGFRHLIADPLLRMNGPEVFAFTLREVPALVEEIRRDRIPDYYLFHQANGMLVKHLAKKCGIDPNDVPMNLDRYGNTSSASIPLLLADSEISPVVRARPLTLGLVAFGAGWSWAAARLSVGPIRALVVESSGD